MKRISKKSLILLLILTIMAVWGLTGCNEKEETEADATTAPTADANAIPTPGAWATAEEIEEYEKKTAANIKLEPAAANYEYKQTENIQNDNYRNYYQIFVYSFCDSNGDGIGDLNGITSKLDYIKDMGFNGLWITPIHQSTTYHKYDVVDYCSVDKQFGTMADFDKLVSECNKRGIKLIMDLVMNHSSSSNEWFKSAFKSIQNGTYASNKYFKYYNFTQTKQDKYFPVGSTGWYYEAEFTSNMPDINLENLDVRKEFEKIVDFWMAKGIGGFRLDASLHYVEDDEAKNVEILNWFSNYVKSKDKNAYIVSEVWTQLDLALNYLEGGIDSVFNFAFGQSAGSIASDVRLPDGGTKFEADLAYLQTALAKHKTKSTAIDAPFIANHDTPRLSGLMGDDETNIKSALALLQTMSGSSFIYYGDELGMNGSGDGDANYRSGMYWSKDVKKNPSSAPGCIVKFEDHKFGSVEEQLTNNTSILNYNKRLLELRNENPEIARGELKVIDSVKDPKVVGISKTYNGSTIYIIINLSKYAKEVTVSKSECKYTDIRGYASSDTNKVSLDGETLKMPGGSVVILK